jgi:arylsulfatase A-like enzyme
MTQHPPNRRKNIVLVSIDDGFAFWRYRTAFGAELKTPNLDRICAESTLFTSAYCQVPICGPSRTSAMSGLSPYETGVFDNYTQVYDVLRPEQLWSFRLREAGYYCSTAGKVHHRYKPLPDEVHNVLYSHPAQEIHFGPRKGRPAIHYGGKLNGRGTTDPDDDRKYYDARSSRNAIRFFNTYKGEEPFYREVGFHHPHAPFRTPNRFKEMYDAAAFRQPEDWAKGFDVSEFTSRFMVENIDLMDLDTWQKTVRNYFSAYSHVDEMIGRVWDGLKKSRHAENTVFVLFSDHGYHMGDKNRLRKFTLWEEAANVPLIVHDPTQPARRADDPVALTDLGPTILDYAGCRPIKKAVGRSLRPVVNGETPPPRAIPTFWYGSPSIRTGPYRMTLYQDGSSEFYDVIKDPWLTRNLAHDSPDYAAARAALVKTCAAYGMSVITADAKPEGAAHFQSVMGSVPHVPAPGSKGALSIGTLPSEQAAPGYRKHFATTEPDSTVSLAPGVKELHFASDTNGGAKVFRARGNGEDNRFIFAGGHRRFDLEVHTGPGNNYVRTSHDSLIAHAGPGENHFVAGVTGSRFYGGPGRTRMEGSIEPDEFFGGPGDAHITTGFGNNKVVSGFGENLIETGEGENTVLLDGGSNTVIAQAGHIRIEIKRTGLPQAVSGFRKGVIDLTDWAVLGAPSVRQVGEDTIVECGGERVVFRNTQSDIVTQSLSGLTRS